MNINELAKAVTQDEGLKKEVNIAQVKEVLRVLNQIMDGALYKMARSLKSK